MYAKYTIVLKDLLDNEQTKAEITNALSKYPLYVQVVREQNRIPVYIPTREELNTKILNYYKYREIGFETIGRFLDELEMAMLEIMPKYNQLFFSCDQDYDIRYNADYTRTTKEQREGSNTGKITGKDDSTAESNVTTTSNDSTNTNVSEANKSVTADTPQSQLSISNKNIDNLTYGSSASWNKNDGTTDSESSGTATSHTESTATNQNVVDSEGSNTEEGLTEEQLKGNYGMVTFQHLIQQYRETIINIEQMIINDRRIQELFMGIY